jgi:acetyl/propionyl-CoA carboxylase alpha subunit
VRLLKNLVAGEDGVMLRGHAIECRINAEDPDRGFAPTPGRLRTCTPPGGPWVRFDSHSRPGNTVPTDYDSLIAKVIIWAEDRSAALSRMGRALDEMRIEGRGVHTTAAFHRKLMDHPVFRGEGSPQGSCESTSTTSERRRQALGGSHQTPAVEPPSTVTIDPVTYCDPVRYRTASTMS